MLARFVQSCEATTWHRKAKDEKPTLLRLPTFWDSHMVLQREPMSSKIWGWGAPGTNVSISLDTIFDEVQPSSTPSTVVVFSIANDDGVWSVNLPPQPASSGRTILIEDGVGTVIVLDDVAFGDVYLCSGQSNMEMSVPATFNATEEVRNKTATQTVSKRRSTSSISSSASFLSVHPFLLSL